jgi:hypothetical protein
MGHTLGTVTQQYHRFISHVSAFRRALRKTDQLALNTLLDEASQHLPAVGYAANLLPGVGILLALVLEKHKQLNRHEVEFELIRREFREGLVHSQHELANEIDQLRRELSLLNEHAHAK